MNGEPTPIRLPASSLHLLVALLLALLGGCGGNGLVEITGTVTYDGQPVQKGTIAFLPSDGKGPTVAAIIAEGKYTAKIFPGAKLVKIEGYKIVGRGHVLPENPRSPMVDITEPVVPARYNEKSELKAEIGPGTRVLDFNLKAATP